MKTMHKALGGILLGTLGLALAIPASAATTSNSAKAGSDYTAGSSIPAGNTEPRRESTESKTGENAEQKSVTTNGDKLDKAIHRRTTNYVKPRGGSEKAELAMTVDLNQQSLRSVEAGSTFTPSIANSGNDKLRDTQVASGSRKNPMARKSRTVVKSKQL
jgi:hypothetical protein